MTSRIEHHEALVLCGYGEKMTAREYGYNDTRERLMAHLEEQGKLDILRSIDGGVYMSAWFASDSPDEIVWACCRSIASPADAPEDAIVRLVAPSRFLVFPHPPTDDRARMWTDDYYRACAMQAPFAFSREWFEYYPEGDLDGPYELWMALKD
ncbi:MAG: hypothetical protein LBR58_09520 [Propionibacteriaceae bacterium]|jgi:predicted transcriptional regulator YdeE|nr:hypothetical protein [Propionibacteriaceae bacterium]